jgi:hypothetical protein
MREPPTNHPIPISKARQETPPSESKSLPLIPGTKKRIYYPELTSLIDLDSRVGFIGSEALHVLYHALRHITFDGNFKS